MIARISRNQKEYFNSLVRRLRDDDVLRSLLLDVVQEYWFEPLLTRKSWQKSLKHLKQRRRNLQLRVIAHCGRMRRRQQISPAKEPNLRERCPLDTQVARRRHQLRQLGDIGRNPPWLIAHDLDQRRGSVAMVDSP